MQVTLNGKPHDIDEGATVADMLRELKLEPIRVAVEINEDIVSRKTFDATRVRAGACIEVVTFVGGGSW
jgi:thiamine biosynthesis protein ThiS